jgi:transposase
LNGIDDAVVLITYPKDAFGNPLALRAFICTDTSLTTDEILDIYAERWQIEVYFRQVKNTLAFDKYQIRSAKGIKRFWLIMSLVHFFCCTVGQDGKRTIFSEGYHFLRNQIQKERVAFVYQCGVDKVPLQQVLDMVV